MTFWARRSPQCRDERSGGSVDKIPAPAEQAGKTPEAEISDPFGRSVPLAELLAQRLVHDDGCRSRPLCEGYQPKLGMECGAPSSPCRDAVSCDLNTHLNLVLVKPFVHCDK